MRVETRRRSTSTTFADATSGEELLQLAADENGLLFMAFHLYDAGGSLVVESDLKQYPKGVVVHGSNGEVLLDVSADASANIRYCLYNSNGALLTKSDGVRTMIYPLLHMDGVGRNWAPPAPSTEVPLA